jgi:uncharacterized membrane protein (UPF0127 family)
MAFALLSSKDSQEILLTMPGKGLYRCLMPGLLACLFALLSPGGADAAALPTERIPATIGKTKFLLEIARTPEEQQRGLMGRAFLASREGMAFVFDQPGIQVFWMKHCLIPLDMLFVRNNRVIRVVNNARPCQEEPCQTYSSVKPVDMVIELAGGSAARYHIKAGTPVQLFADGIPVFQSQKTP